MEPADFLQCARVLMDILRKQHPDEYSTLMNALTTQEQPA
jgi:hypothetical protein